MGSSEQERARGHRDATATREALLRAGADLFARYGFGGTTVEQIARRAGANKAMISYHFGGKQGLYEDIIISSFSEGAARLQALLDSGCPPEDLLRGAVATFSDLAARRPAFPAMMLREGLSGGRHLSERVFPHFIAVFVRVRQIFEIGTRDGTFRPVDPLLTHLVLIGALVFFHATEPLRVRLISEGKVPVPRLPRSEEFGRSLEDLMLRGIAAAPFPARPDGRGAA